MPVIYCDHCGAKRCVAIAMSESRMVFRKDGIFEGVKPEKIERCAYRETDVSEASRDETKVIEVDFKNGI